MTEELAALPGMSASPGLSHEGHKVGCSWGTSSCSGSSTGRDVPGEMDGAEQEQHGGGQHEPSHSLVPCHLSGGNKCYLSRRCYKVIPTKLGGRC